MSGNDTVSRTRDACPDDFRGVRDWVFDLDNTLYPRHVDLFSQIDQRMTSFVSDLLQLPRDEARVLQKDFCLLYTSDAADE